MDNIDDMLRLLLPLMACIVAIVFFLGGKLTAIAGTWYDGDIEIQLTQSGPWVKGHAEVLGGEQYYQGIVCFGFLRLTRTDSGALHLKNMGFSKEQMPLLQDNPTGRFSMRLQNHTLQGKFFGYKFSFDDNKIQSTTVMDGKPRSWSKHPSKQPITTSKV